MPSYVGMPKPGGGPLDTFPLPPFEVVVLPPDEEVLPPVLFAPPDVLGAPPEALPELPWSQPQRDRAAAKVRVVEARSQGDCRLSKDGFIVSPAHVQDTCLSINLFCSSKVTRS